MSKKGKIYSVAFRYFDLKTNSMKIKKRPFLVLKEEKGKRPIDLTVIPISKITDESRRSKDFDLEIKKDKYPKLRLKETISFIRTHKVQTISEKDLINVISENIEEEYPELFEEIIKCVQKFFADI